MSGAPAFKVYTPDGKYVAACKHPEDAASLAALYGDGATVRHGHRKKFTVWTEGRDGCAGDSYDTAAAHMVARIDAWWAALHANAEGQS